MNATIQSTDKASAMELTALAQEFLAREAKLLDERRFWQWFELLEDDVIYAVPIRQARTAFENEVPEGAYRIYDTKTLVQVRIRRMDCGAGWAEVPPSRTLRVVGSVFVERTDKANELAVESAVLLYRQRGHNEPGDVIPVRRRDVLRLTANGPRLLKREALLTDAVLNTPNLGVFL